jgi:threonine dehydratase
MNSPKIQKPEIINQAYKRIENYIDNTPLLYSEILNKLMSSNVYFKMDAMQKTGSFKLRGVLNSLLTLKEIRQMPKKIVSYSTGNHALAMAYTAKLFGIHARVYLPANVSSIKKDTARYYEAEVIEVETRSQAEELALQDKKRGFYYLHPSDNDEIIAGAGTMCYEALKTMQNYTTTKPDAIFASCGGGGLLAGTYLAKELLSPYSQVIGAEPRLANDAYKSLRANRIIRFSNSPKTIADGLRTLSISLRTFHYLKKLDGFYLLDEEAIYRWTAWIIQTTKVICEPSGAICMAAASNWLKAHGPGKTVLILISGGNIDPTIYLDLFQRNYLEKLPYPK